MSEGSMHRRRPSSPAQAAPFPDNDDILREILLRLPPLPSSLPRASLVSKRWRRILSDPHFLRRFRAFHHGRAPLLGFFVGNYGNPYFTPTLDPPDRIPSARLSPALPRGDGDGSRWTFLGCRHGLALILNSTRLEITVCDPVTGDQRCVPLPPWFSSQDARFGVVQVGALLCDDHARGAPLESFEVVVLRTDDVMHHADPRAFAFLYESKDGVWSSIISTFMRAPLWLFDPSVLVGNSLYWLLVGDGKNRILKFDLDRKNLTVIDTPPDAPDSAHQQILRMEDSTLGFAVMIGYIRIQIWEKKPNSEGAAKWMLHKTIDLFDDLFNLLSLVPSCITINGYDEDDNAIFVSADHQIFMIQLKSLQFKSLFKSNKTIFRCHPFKSIYTTDPYYQPVLPNTGLHPGNQ